MKANVGDRLVTASTIVDQPPRDGRVVELRHEDGSPPFVVEWSDTGERTLVFPGPDTHVVAATGEQAAGPSSSGVKTWTVQIRITEEGDATSATALLGAGGPEPAQGDAGRTGDAAHTWNAVGSSRRNPSDPASPLIGDEVAVARALRLLADRLMETADADISSSTGSRAHLTS